MLSASPNSRRYADSRASLKPPAWGHAKVVFIVVWPSSVGPITLHLFVFFSKHFGCEGLDCSAVLPCISG